MCTLELVIYNVYIFLVIQHICKTIFPFFPYFPLSQEAYYLTSLPFLCQQTAQKIHFISISTYLRLGQLTIKR